jgi:serine/threonine protein phosphatase PrpC
MPILLTSSRLAKAATYLLSSMDMEVSTFSIFNSLGCEVALFAKKHYVEELMKLDSFSKEKDYPKALTEVNQKIDEMLKDSKKELIKLANNGEQENSYEVQAGCTANVVLITPDKIYCANAGDSRAIMCKKGEVKALSIDHKPDDKCEKDRIVKAFGTVENGRVDGTLAVSRALGDL